MRLMSCVATALALSLTVPAWAQEWDEHVVVEDGFVAAFPGTPRVEAFTWMSEYGYPLPARTYSASRGQERYSVTVVDYRPLETLGPERSKQCPAGAETCIGTNDGRNGVITGLGYWKMDARGGMMFAIQKLLTRPGVTLGELSLQFIEVVEGYSLHLLNPDKSRTFASVAMHENRLYVFEGTTPAGSPTPSLFQNSGGFVDEKGEAIRYLDYYSNGVHGLRQYPRPAYRAGGVTVGTLLPQAAPGPPPGP